MKSYYEWKRLALTYDGEDFLQMRPPACLWYQEYFLGNGAPSAEKVRYNSDWYLGRELACFPPSTLDGIYKQCMERWEEYD